MIMDFEIRCNTRFSWSYIYMADRRKREIWADSCEKLKSKVLGRNLPWDDDKVPETKPTNIRSTYMGAISHEGSPASFRLPWCKSNYKRY